MSNDLLHLPPCPITACAKCGAKPEEAGWIDLRIGCGACLPGRQDMLDLSVHIAGLTTRIELLEDVIRQIHGDASQWSKAQIEQRLRALRIRDVLPSN